MLIPSQAIEGERGWPSLSRRVNANSQPTLLPEGAPSKLIKKGEC